MLIERIMRILAILYKGIEWNTIEVTKDLNCQSKLVKEIYISENSNIKSNKVLNSKKFTEITGIKSPNWDDLIPDFKNDCKKYANLYKN